MPAITVTAAVIAGYSKDCLCIIIYAVQVLQVLTAFVFCALIMASCIPAGYCFCVSTLVIL